MTKKIFQCHSLPSVCEHPVRSNITRKDHPEFWEARLRRILRRVEELTQIRREERFLKQQQEESLEQPTPEHARIHLRLVPDE